MIGRLPIEEVSPQIACGQFPAKAVVGERVPIAARCYREGHEALGCDVSWTGPDGVTRPFVRMHPGAPGLDLWHASIQPDTVGMWTFTVEAFDDPYLSWRHAVTKKIEAGQDAADLGNELAEGAAMFEQAAEFVPAKSQAWVLSAAAALRDDGRPLFARVSSAMELGELLWEFPLRHLVTASPTHELWVDRQRGLYSAWYEIFPRSESEKPGVHGTFATAAHCLPEVAQMGFDVLYLTPIHPIGRISRKGRNNALVAADGDVGSPYAIGAAEGGHDAIHPQLGTMEDFREFVVSANRAGLEVALDLALQCAPDHPWVSEHPEWFTTRADGHIAYAENPPKKYQDIYPLNFDNDPQGLQEEVLRIVLHWVRQGVKIFRVDNPHTKPVSMWHWLIWQVKQTDPDVLFLAEAFTTPAMMHGLAKAGFTQSYTYFTWRTNAADMRRYCEELLGAAEYMRPNFWPTTHDILTPDLQFGGPPMFKIRAVLAGMLSPSYGIYAGYELFEHVARAGVEEYVDNEKYELKSRDRKAARTAGESLAPFLSKLNEIRRLNPALHWLRNLRFHDVDNGALLIWSKRDPDSDNTVLVACSFDPNHEQWGNVTLDMAALGFEAHHRFTVRDELTGAEYQWGQHNVVGLNPHIEPAHIFTVHRHD
ncbi:alpha-1,4-glucan:maltose-1-phosphate maltosyltransferase [Rhizocola hellebori]|uniref:Alpha-1,4-glucan:maltose-1-phosphate maltosyltransferase n=1 Tax=Rhizocola hellebori TaxID=1392758 RepID=A0A8J3VFP4_9ACTN|nr:alpha-1,4-glucan--maltose-1-phosphate maltosyltransferase [Rhizocola hellebori]GIH05544.1 alpha-1,4-glucan:maltose-1-phosphate maltosyltransferase [Rhizocola hellebori]